MSLTPGAPSQPANPRKWALLPTILVLALVAASCASTGDGTEASDSAPGSNSSSGQDDSSLCQPTDDGPTFDPLDTDAEWDLSGGVKTGNGTSEVTVTENGADQLDLRVASTAKDWATNWDRSTIDIGEIFSGGVQRDQIPPIDKPTFETVAQACEWLTGNQPGALVIVDDEARFYPLSILTRHEIVNDRIGDVPVAVTFCPLCNTALAFDRRVDNEVRRFGVSGLLRNSDMVMWDDTTESVWQQITGESIAGDSAGTKLDIISTSIVSFEQFSASFPEGRSLSRDTGFGIPYGSNPYVGYSSSDRPFLFDGEIDDRLPALERVVGVTVQGSDVAYPFSELELDEAINDTIEDTPVVVWRTGTTADALDQGQIAESSALGTAIAFDPVVDGDTLIFASGDDGTFTDEQTGSTWDGLGLAVDGPLEGTRLQTVAHTNEFWFAWAAFFPEGALYNG